MGFNKRKMEDQRRDAANKEAATRRATDAQVLEDAERLIAAWNERQAISAPMIFSPTIGAAIRTGCALSGLPNAASCAPRTTRPRKRKTRRGRLVQAVPGRNTLKSFSCYSGRTGLQCKSHSVVCTLPLG
jgi:hypothetical protein